MSIEFNPQSAPRTIAPLANLVEVVFGPEVQLTGKALSRFAANYSTALPDQFEDPRAEARALALYRLNHFQRPSILRSHVLNELEELEALNPKSIDALTDMMTEDAGGGEEAMRDASTIRDGFRPWIDAPGVRATAGNPDAADMALMRLSHRVAQRKAERALNRKPLKLIRRLFGGAARNLIEPPKAA